MPFEIIYNYKPPVARKLTVRHKSFVCLTANFLATGGFVKLFHIFHDFSMIIQAFSNSMIFPCMELFFLIFRFSLISRACGNPVKIVLKFKVKDGI